MPHWKLFYHLVWATHLRQELLVPPLEEALYRLMAHQCEAQKGYALALNGMPDHAHVVCAIPPMISVAAYVKNLKGTTSRAAGQEFNLDFQWQAGYGAFTISERNLERAVEYVRRQKDHHAAGTTIPRFARFDTPADDPSRSRGDDTRR